MIQITPIYPTAYESDVNLSSEILIKFSNDVNPESILVLLSGKKVFSERVVASGYNGSLKDWILSFKPTQTLPKSHIIEVDIHAEDIIGNLAITNYVFRTTKDDLRPEVIAFAPSADSLLLTNEVPIFVHVEDEQDLDFQQITIKVNGDPILQAGKIPSGWKMDHVGTGRGYKINLRKLGGFRVSDHIRVEVEAYDTARNFLHHEWKFQIAARG